MKRLVLGLLVWLMMCGSAFAWPWDDVIYYQKLTFASVVQDKNTAGLGEIKTGPGAIILWWTVESSASVDYDVLFFSEADSTWDADTVYYYARKGLERSVDAN